MREIRIAVRCSREPLRHAKILRIDAKLGKKWAETLAQLLDGTSPLYIHKPGPLSPIGKCGVCCASVEAEVMETELSDAEFTRQCY